MSLTTLTVSQIVKAGLTQALAAANADGSYVPNDGRVFLHVKNGSESSINVTIETPNTVDGNAIADLVVAVGAGVEKLIGPFAPGIYNDEDANVKVTFSAVTSITIAALRL